MEKLYKNLSDKTFKYLSSFLLLIADLTIIFYIYNKFSDKELFRKSAEKVLPLMGLNPDTVDPTFYNELYQLSIQNLLIMLALIAIFHLFVYAMYIRGKMFARYYVAIYSWTGFVGCLLAVFINPVFIILSCIFGYVAFGLKHFQSKVSDENRK